MTKDEFIEKWKELTCDEFHYIDDDAWGKFATDLNSVIKAEKQKQRNISADIVEKSELNRIETANLVMNTPSSNEAIKDAKDKQ